MKGAHGKGVQLDAGAHLFWGWDWTPCGGLGSARDDLEGCVCKLPFIGPNAALSPSM